MITTKQLKKSFGSGDLVTEVLRGIDLEIPAGQFTAIVGPSGAGKSTLLYQLSLLDHPTSGDLRIDGMDALGLSSDERTAFRLTHLGYVFQDYALVPELTAAENVMVPMLMQGLSGSSAFDVAEAALERVGLTGKGRQLPSQLSGGQQQRVSIARAVAHNPKILFADEPTANLDSATSREILKLFLELHGSGQTIVMVTHEPEFARMSQRVVELADGRITGDHKP